MSDFPIKLPTRWAADIRQILKTVGNDGFPLDVATIAKELSKQWCPEDPIIEAVGDNLPGFEGSLAPVKGKGWAIIYDNSQVSTGRVRFTLAHEFGHYLQHRLINPAGFQCKGQDFLREDEDYQKMESEANIFASNLLMPLDDFRQQLEATSGVDFATLGDCASHYGVSLTAATKKWLEYTEKRALFICSRDGFILWSWSSKSAYKSGLFIKTSDIPPREIPSTSLTAITALDSRESVSIKHPACCCLGA